MRTGGLDVSRGKTSDTVLAVWETDMVTGISVLDQVEIRTFETLPEVVNFANESIEELDLDILAIDASGLGAGGYDYLMNGPNSHRIVAFISNERASREWEDPETRHQMEKTYVNFKSRIAVEFRRRAYAGKIRINVDIPCLQRLKDDLGGYTLTKINHRTKLDDPKVSPDVGDAALMGWSVIDAGESFWIGD